MTTAPNNTVLRLTGVCRVHGSGPTAVHALREVDLTVEPGELVAVMGPSGSGKSTLLNVAGGLDPATSGEVHVQGVPLRGRSPLSSRASKLPRKCASVPTASMQRSGPRPFVISINRS